MAAKFGMKIDFASFKLEVADVPHQSPDSWYNIGSSMSFSPIAYHCNGVLPSLYYIILIPEKIHVDLTRFDSGVFTMTFLEHWSERLAVRITKVWSRFVTIFVRTCGNKWLINTLIVALIIRGEIVAGKCYEVSNDVHRAAL